MFPISVWGKLIQGIERDCCEVEKIGQMLCGQQASQKELHNRSHIVQCRDFLNDKEANMPGEPTVVISFEISSIYARSQDTQWPVVTIQYDPVCFEDWIRFTGGSGSYQQRVAGLCRPAMHTRKSTN